VITEQHVTFVEESFTETMVFDMQKETLFYAVATQSNKDLKYFQVACEE